MNNYTYGYVLLNRDNTASTRKVFHSESQAKSHFSRSTSPQVFFKDQSEVRVEPLYPKYVIEDYIEQLEVAHRDNDLVSVEFIINHMKNAVGW